MQADLGTDFDHTHAVIVFIFFLSLRSFSFYHFVSNSDFSFNIFYLFIFLDGGREEGGLSKDPCNDGALFIIHENEGYVVFFHSIFEKIVPVQAIRIYISIISLFFFQWGLLSHFTSNRDYRKWYFQAFFFFFNFDEQILIFVSLILSKNENQSESFAYLHNKIFHWNTIRSEKAFVNLSMYILKNLEFEIIKNFFFIYFHDRWHLVFFI